MQKKRVLILHGQPGMGHLMPAKAVVEAFSIKYPEIEVKNEDAFAFFSDILRYRYSPFYNLIVFKAPILFKLFYDGYNYSAIRAIYELVTLLFTKKHKLVTFIEDFSPDFILATNPVPLQMLSLIKKREITDIPSGNVCTDFGFHSVWYDKSINYYFVANDFIKKSFIKQGASQDVIKITGIPVAQKYVQLPDRQKILADLNFDPSYPILLIIGGQLQYRELKGIILGIKKHNKRAQVILVAGRDKKLQKKLRNSRLKNEAGVKIFNFVNNLQEYMSVADLVLSKAGGSTVAECLVMGLPMIFNRIIPGQETDNVNYLVNSGAGVKAVGVKKIVEKAVDLLNHREKLAEMKENCKKIAKPDAASDIADFVASKILQINN